MLGGAILKKNPLLLLKFLIIVTALKLEKNISHNIAEILNNCALQVFMNIMFKVILRTL